MVINMLKHKKGIVFMPWANLQGTNLQGTNLAGANLQVTNLRDANLQGTNLQGTNLRDANLQGANLQGANLHRADLWDANLHRANLQGTNLQGTNLAGANLHRANLQGADLQVTDLQGANLQGADLRGANLRGANLRGANLRGADLRSTCLDPSNTPNGLCSEFEQVDGMCVGYRTQKALFKAETTYESGKTYEAPFFSTADTECHPGLYVCPSEEDVSRFCESYGKPDYSVIKVVFYPEDCHKAGSKWRVKRLTVIKK